MNYKGKSLQIWFHNYALKRKVKPNAVTNSLEQRGALLKIQDDDANEGFSDLCPWPSLGDHTLEEEMATQGPLFRRALDLALVDLEARKNKIQLVAPTPIKNNILISDFRDLKSDFDFSTVTVKIKGNEHVYDLAAFLVENANRFHRIRIDFNYCISEFLFSEFIHLLSQDVLKKIEYIEDPFFFHQDQWSHWDAVVPLALDWNQQEGSAWPRRIWKPSREEQVSVRDFSITSAMEHPVGLAHGLHYAQMYPKETHGFLTVDQYEENQFSTSFTVKDDLLTYQTDGYGIGFATVFERINWVPLFDGDNFLLSNHRASFQEKKDLFKIKNLFTESTGNKNFVLIPSSGSTQNSHESVKVIALEEQALINSALRVNREFNIDDSSVWGCVLPLFHVGGLGIYLRAKLSGAKVHYTSWDQFSLQWLNEHRITHLSLVPTQVFEIVQKNWSAPAFVKVVFVGGAELTSELTQKAQGLGWPIVQTFGMTETASMIAVKKDQDDFFQALPDVKINQEAGYLKIYSDSNASYILKLNLQTQKLISEKLSDWIFTQDQIQLAGNKFKFLQRQSDFVKVKGEGVSLPELRQHLGQNKATICDVPDSRDGVTLILVITPGVDAPLLLEKYNAVVRPYEKIHSWVQVSEIPVTELGKIKYNQLKEMIKDLHVKKL